MRFLMLMLGVTVLAAVLLSPRAQPLGAQPAPSPMPTGTLLGPGQSPPPPPGVSPTPTGM